MATTIVYVTQDQEEAMVLGGGVAVLRSGKLQQFDRPSEIYRRPANLFVAGFIGTPAMNFFRARFHTEDGNAYLDAPWLRRKLDVTLHVQHEQNIVMGI